MDYSEIPWAGYRRWKTCSPKWSIFPRWYKPSPNMANLSRSFGCLRDNSYSKLWGLFKASTFSLVLGSFNWTDFEDIDIKSLKLQLRTDYGVQWSYQVDCIASRQKNIPWLEKESQSRTICHLLVSRPAFPIVHSWRPMNPMKKLPVSSSFVKDLVTLGAMIVGKTKLCAFASAGEATDHAPFNPRGDGYQSPSGGTTGGAVALAGYDWIDYSVGTDTAGSTRMPAARNVIFAIRTSTDALLLKGIYPSCRYVFRHDSKTLPYLRWLQRDGCDWPDESRPGFPRITDQAYDT